MSSTAPVDEITLDALPSQPFADRKHLPRISAVYFALAESGAVLYIGATEDLHHRWVGRHHHEKTLAQQGCTVIAYHAMEIAALRVVERAMIARFSPLLNRPWRRRQPCPSSDLTKVPISLRALSQRLQRKLAREQKLLKAVRHVCASKTSYYVVDLTRSQVIMDDVDPVVLAHELGVLNAWETVVEEER